MRRVYKFPFRVEDDVTLTMSRGAEILHVDAQQGVPCVWARVDPEADLVPRRFRLAGTGHDLPDDVGPDGYPSLVHVGSFQLVVLDAELAQLALAFHLFEIT